MSGIEGLIFCQNENGTVRNIVRFSWTSLTPEAAPGAATKLYRHQIRLEATLWRYKPVPDIEEATKDPEKVLQSNDVLVSDRSFAYTPRAFAKLYGATRQDGRFKAPCGVSNLERIRATADSLQ